MILTVGNDTLQGSQGHSLGHITLCPFILTLNVISVTSASILTGQIPFFNFAKMMEDLPDKSAYFETVKDKLQKSSDSRNFSLSTRPACA